MLPDRLETAETKRRRPTGGLDVARFVAAIAIVGFHSLAFAAYLPVRVALFAQVLQTWLYAAVPLFFLMSGVLDAPRQLSGSDPAWLRRRTSRLLLLYVVWTAFFLVFRVATHTFDKVLAEGAVGILLFGMATDHLWFLLVLAECAALTWLVRRWRVPASAAYAAAAVLAAVYVVAVSTHAFGSNLVPYLYRTPMLWWLYYLAGVAIGGRGDELDVASARSRLAWLIVPAAAVGVLNSVPPGNPLAFVAFIASTSTIALVALFSAMASGLERGRTARVGALALGIYVLHPAVVSALEIPWKRLGLQSPPLVRGTVVWLAAVLICVAVVRVLLATPLRRFVT